MRKPAIDIMRRRPVGRPLLVFLLAVWGTLCSLSFASGPDSLNGKRGSDDSDLVMGAARTNLYFPFLYGKRVGMVLNNTSLIGGRRSVDSLLSAGIQVVKLFGPEHGFSGRYSAATPIGDSRDPETAIPVISLFGQHVKPSAEDLKGIDVLLFDMQDVGVRFYTYLSTLHYVMEACAENDVPLLVLDRPNPNDFYVDGPILEPQYRSFIGVDPLPIVHGLTLGEYARMVNGEHWLKDGIQCDLRVIPMLHYHHGMGYHLPEPPSPNLRDQQALLLYPTLCLFGGTVISDGRGTYFPFEMIGNPKLKGKYAYSFMPVAIPGMTEHPPLQGKQCYGLDLRSFDTGVLRQTGRLHLEWLLAFYDAYPDKAHFFVRELSADSDRIAYHFDALVGSDHLRKQIIAGQSLKTIHDSWDPGLRAFKTMRKKYLLYR